MSRRTVPAMRRRKEVVRRASARSSAPISTRSRRRGFERHRRPLHRARQRRWFVEQLFVGHQPREYGRAHLSTARRDAVADERAIRFDRASAAPEILSPPRARRQFEHEQPRGPRSSTTDATSRRCSDFHCRSTRGSRSISASASSTRRRISGTSRSTT